MGLARIEVDNEASTLITLTYIECVNNNLTNTMVGRDQ